MPQGTYNQTPPNLVDGQNSTFQMDSAGRLLTAGQSIALSNGTDRSGTTSATAGTSTQLAAANTARRGLNIQNTSAGTIGVNEVAGTAAIGAAGTYTIPAGGSFNVRTTQRVNVVGSAASLTFTATEF